MKYRDWRCYQEATAAVLRRRGWLAEVDVMVQGLRSKHQIDVYLRYETLGFPCKGIIECKLCKRRVTQQSVLTMLARLQDTGAQLGVIISESGFNEVRTALPGARA